MNEKRCLWVLKFDLCLVLYLIIFSIRYRKVEICFLFSDSIAVSLYSLLSRFSILPEARQVSLNLSESEYLECRISEQSIWWLANTDWACQMESIVDEHISRKVTYRIWPKSRSRRIAHAWLVHQTTTAIRPFLSLASYVHYLSLSGSSTCHKILLPKVWFSIPIGTFLKRVDVSFDFYYSPSFTLVFSLGGNVLDKILGRIRRILLKSRSTQSLSAPARVDMVIRKGPKLNALYSKGFSESRFSDLYWCSGQLWNPKEIFYSIESKASLLTDSDLVYLVSHGYNYGFLLAGLMKDRARGNDVVGFDEKAHRNRQVHSLVWLFLAIAQGFGCRYWWQCFKLFQLFRAANQYISYFDSTEALIDLRMDLSRVEHIVAMHSLGGIAAGAQWTSDIRLHPLTLLCYHVFFAWGPAYRCLEEDVVQNPLCLVYCGHVYDYSFDAFVEEGKALRRQLLEDGAGFVVAVFDEAHTPDAFYVELFKWLSEDDNLFLLVKPKRIHNILEEERFASLLDDCVGTGRCMILVDDEGGHISNNGFSAITASAAADISISCALSSVGVEAALSGGRTVYWNIHGQKDHPVSGSSNLDFASLGDLLSAARLYRKSPSLLSNLGCHRHIVDQLDPFRDGGARNRMGEFLRYCFDALRQGLPRMEAIEQAACAYRESWGHDMVKFVRPCDDTL